MLYSKEGNVDRLDKRDEISVLARLLPADPEEGTRGEKTPVIGKVVILLAFPFQESRRASRRLALNFNGDLNLQLPGDRPSVARRWPISRAIHEY